MEAPRAELRELREKRENLMAELREAVAEGREDQAAELTKRLGALEREIARSQRLPGPGARARRERPEPPRPEGNEPERREQHLREAVEHLHAAGLPDLAEKVGQAGEERLRAGMHARPGAPPEALDQLHAQINELRERMGQLEAQLERLAREKR